MALVVITKKAYSDQPGTDLYPNLAGKAKKSAANTALKWRGFSRAAKRSCKIEGFWPPGTTSLPAFFNEFPTSLARFFCTLRFAPGCQNDLDFP